MPIPPLDSRGFLPPGIHQCSLIEMKGRFGRFQKSDKRSYLFVRLESFSAEAKRAGIVSSIIVDGSRLEPNACKGILQVTL
jgi:hypothetical protein